MYIGSPFRLRVGSSRSRRHKEGTPPVHGKTRSFDTDYSFRRDGSHSPYYGARHVSTGSLDATSSSKYRSSLETSFQDTTDSIHHRSKYGGTSSASKDLLSSKMYSTKISDSSENLAMKSLSESTRLHHNQSLINQSAKSSSMLQEQHYTSSSSYGNFNGNGHGGYHGDLVVEGDGLGVVLINSTVTVAITSEFGQTSLENVRVEVTGM